MEPIITDQMIEKFNWNSRQQSWTKEVKRRYLQDLMKDEMAKDAEEAKKFDGMSKAKHDQLADEYDICPTCKNKMQIDRTTELFICLNCIKAMTTEEGTAPHSGTQAW